MPKINTGEPWEQNLRKKVRSISKLRKLNGFTVSQTRGKAILRFKNRGEKRTIGRMLQGNWTEDNAENLLAEISDFIGSEECYLWASKKKNAISFILYILRKCEAHQYDPIEFLGSKPA